MTKQKIEKPVKIDDDLTHKFKNGIYRNTLKVKADRPDINDLRFKNAFVIDRANWKPRTNNAENCPAPLDQGSLGSCTANSFANHVRYVHKLNYTPSRLFIYYNERMLEGSIEIDSGAELRDGIKVLTQFGVCPEEEWPYDISQFTKKPSDKCYKDANQELVHKYYRIEDTDDLKQNLSDGFLASFGFTAYDFLDSKKVAQTGFLPLPKLGDQAIGGHAVLAVDYGVAGDFLNQASIDAWGINHSMEVVKVMNSWGVGDWGIGGSGYFLMPLAYFSNPELVSDVWVIRPN